MNSAAFFALSPLLILALGAIALMLQIAFWRTLRATTSLAVLTLIIAALAAINQTGTEPQLVTPLLQADRMALLMSALFCLAGAVTVVLSQDYLLRRGDEPEEYFLLLILSVMGACVLAYATHLASLLLGLELLSISLYALIAYPDKSVLPLEAAIKYLVLSGAASATTLFGFALLYAATGTMEFTALGRELPAAGSPVVLTGAAMVLAGLAFKLSVVPFHLWTPDVYEGAPAPITGFLASVSKAAIFIVMLRLFLEADLFRYRILIECIGLMAILSMLAGNLLALLQTNIKRLLAYSSIAHVGYLLIIYMSVANGGERSLAIEAALYFLLAYVTTTIAAFALLALISVEEEAKENVELHHVNGLLWRQPLLAGLMLVALLSLAGIPLTAGFIAKFYLVNAAISGQNWVLLASLVIGSGIGIYYYLRVVFYMTQRPKEHDHRAITPENWPVQTVSCALIASILLLGTFPQHLMEFLRSIL